MEGEGLVDSHCHLDRYDEEERHGVICRAAAAGVRDMVTIGTRLSEVATGLAIARVSPEPMAIWCTVGTHPQYVDDEVAVSPDDIAALADELEIIGIGETGLDFAVAASDRRLQEKSFRLHIEAARLARVPLIIHSRGADADTARVLRDEQSAGTFDFVLHCFSAGRALAETGIELGGYLSFSGILTFPKSTELRAIASSVPNDRLMLETDSPFLAPVPFRGRPNEPAFLFHTARVLAETIGCSPGEIVSMTSRNFRRLFRKAR